MDTNLLKKIVNKISTPVFVYEETKLTNNIRGILDAAAQYKLEKRIKIYIPYFCNSNPYLFKLFSGIGTGIVLQDEEEYYQVKKHKLANNIIVSPAFLSDEEIDFWVKNNVLVNLASLEEVKYFIDHFKEKPLCFRVDITRDSNQRLAIKRHQLNELSTLLKKHGIIPHAVHIYVGTGSSLEKMRDNLLGFFKIWKDYFPQVKNINLGGGFGFDYDTNYLNSKHFNWSKYFSFLGKKINEFSVPDSVNFLLEPGRDIFADVGQMLIKVKRVVQEKGFKNLSTDGSYVYMPSATIRARQHNLNFYDKRFKELPVSKKFGVLSGSTTLSTDYVFPGKIKIPSEVDAGDFIVVNDIGAYGATQHMEFLNKKPCPEVLIRKDGKAYLITSRGKDDDKLRYLLAKPKQL